MRDKVHTKLDEVVIELTKFINYEYSSRFKSLSPREDRQLFFLAQMLTKLKFIDSSDEEEDLSFGKVIPFCEYKRKKSTKLI